MWDSWKLLLRYVDYFLPKPVSREKNDYLFQHRLVIAILLLALPLCVVFFMVDFSRGAFEYAAITAGFTSFCIGGLWLIKKQGKSRVVGFLFNLIPILTLTRACIQEGGLTSIYIPMIMVVPSLGFIMSGRKGGSILTLLSFTSLTLILIFSPLEIIQVSRYLILILSLVFWTVCVLLFYQINHSALRKVMKANLLLETVNDELESRSSQLRNALESNKEILGITAHDLKNPLGGIIGLAEMVLEDTRTGPQAAYDSVVDNVPTLKEESERMLQIIKELLEKQHQTPESEIRKQTAQLEEVISSVIRWNAKQAGDKQITLIFESDETFCAEIDVMSIQRAVDNYVSNAIKYSPPQSTVWVEVKKDANNAIVSVRDEGPGLTEQDMNRVFGKMQRLSAKPTGNEHSTGLGLFIVKQIVEAHGGKVGVKSTHGEGATFWFCLPRCGVME